MITKRKKIQYDKHWTIDSFKTPIDYVKQLFNSVNAVAREDYIASYESHGRKYVAGSYEKTKDERQKKLIAGAIVQLLDDPDYSCDAIPVVAELGLPEAKEWFLNLSKKPIEEIRNIKTSDYTSGFGCLLRFSSEHNEFLPFLKEIISSSKLTPGEYSVVLNRISSLDPEFILSNYKEFLEKELIAWNETIGAKKHVIYGLFCPAFDKAGLEKCLEIAKKIKNEMLTEVQMLYYNSLKQLPKFKPHLEELKKILEIE